MVFVYRGVNPGHKPIPVKVRLIRNCDMSGGPDSCWIWKSEGVSGKYGQITYDNKKWKANRLSWTIFVGPIPEGKIVCHTCDVRSCINPKHLFIGTYQDNMDDMKSKGRDRRIGATEKIGSKHKDAKLTEAKVLEIRRLKSIGVSSSKLSHRFGVSVNQINVIVRRKNWKHI